MNIFSLLLVLSDFSFLLLRLAFGSFVFFNGLKKFSKTKYLGLIDLVFGAFIFFGLMMNFASFFIAFEIALVLFWKIFNHKFEKEELALHLVLFALALYLLTKNAGLLSLDESVFGLF